MYFMSRDIEDSSAYRGMSRIRATPPTHACGDGSCEVGFRVQGVGSGI